MPRMSRRTSTPSIAWTFSLSSNDVAIGTPASSCPSDRMRPSITAVVGGLPRSWQTAPSMIATCSARDRVSIPPRASSMTSSVCTQTSPSGCHSGSCGHPTSGRSSGRSASTTPMSSASANPRRRSGRVEQQLLDLAPDAFTRQVVERNRAKETRASRRRPRARSARPTARRATREGCRRRTSAGRRREAASPGGRRVSAERIEILAGQRIPARWR